ncbi:MAG: APC family permease [Lachnospiraceae bacterium]
MKKKFGLFTSVCMIIGIVIGSGIFFKSDNVLVATNGSVALGVLVFFIAAFAIIFGSLTISELAMRTDSTGGIIAYAEENIGRDAAFIFGWIQNFIYYPTITIVVSWVTGIYGCILFGVEATLELQILIGFLVYTLLYIMNYLSARLAGYFQNLSTVIKLLPLALIAVAGLCFGNPDFSAVSRSTAAAGSIGWLTAIGPIAFSYDGWTVAPSISHEIKDARKNLPRALIIAPIFILVFYITYFAGISRLVDPQTIMVLGDAHVDLAFNSIMGPIGSKIALVFVIISIMGTTNGLILGGSRGLYALGTKNMIPGASHLCRINPRTDIPTTALISSYVISTLWMAVHYLTTRLNLLPNSDISEISIVTMYLLYIALYIQVIRLKKNGEIKSAVKGYLNPILAIIGSLIIFGGGIQNAMFFVYLGFSIIVIIMAGWYSKKHPA